MVRQAHHKTLTMTLQRKNATNITNVTYVPGMVKKVRGFVRFARWVLDVGR